MYCKNCGKKIDNDSKFCSFCGAKQSTINQERTGDRKINENIGASIYQGKIKTESETSTQQEPQFKNKNEPFYDYSNAKYDPFYEKNNDAAIVGITLLVLSLIFLIYGPIKGDTPNGTEVINFTIYALSFILRIAFVAWVVKIAKDQNRNPVSWGILTAIFPNPMLVIAGFSRRKLLEIPVPTLTNHILNSNMLSNKAKTLYKEEKYVDSIHFSKKAVEYNPENKDAKQTLQDAKYVIKEKLKTEYYHINNIITRRLSNGLALEIYLPPSDKYINIREGLSVTIDGEVPKDGEYLSKNRSYKIVSGKIDKITIITSEESNG